MVYQIAQPVDAYLKSLSQPLKSHMQVIPEYPGSKPTYFMKDYGTETTLEVSSTASVPEQITKYYDNTLEASGWKRPLNQKKGIRIYLKGDEIILISAHEALDGHSRLTRVHKKQNVEK